MHLLPSQMCGMAAAIGMNITKAEAAMLAARAQAPVTEGWRDGALTVWIPGRPTHFKGRGDRFTVSRHTKDWRERTASRLYPHVLAKVTRVVSNGMTTECRWPWSPYEPKLIAFVVYCPSAFDEDENLRLVCSAAKDALKDMQIIDDDRRSSGHTFVYTQVVTRKRGAAHGIAIRIALSDPAR